MAVRDLPWPFGDSDGGPASRPRVVRLEGVLVAVLEDGPAGERARAALVDRVGEDGLRLYDGATIVAYDEEFRAARGLAGRVAGAVLDDRPTMGRYVDYGREGRSALWVRVPTPEDADAVVRLLSDHPVLHIWYHGHDGVETLHIA
jgi:hypothetical protein